MYSFTPLSHIENWFLFFKPIKGQKCTTRNKKKRKSMSDFPSSLSFSCVY